jgi:Na+/H+-dicarboxylate symporter
MGIFLFLMACAGLRAQVFSQYTTAMFVIMAVVAEILPIGAVGRIVVMISVAMVNCQ